MSGPLGRLLCRLGFHHWHRRIRLTAGGSSSPVVPREPCLRCGMIRVLVAPNRWAVGRPRVPPRVSCSDETPLPGSLTRLSLSRRLPRPDAC